MIVGEEDILHVLGNRVVLFVLVEGGVLLHTKVLLSWNVLIAKRL